jgi:hypothetical protein
MWKRNAPSWRQLQKSEEIGASGSTVENDHKVVMAGYEVIEISDLPEHLWRT